jgi:hypothetical protein
MLGVRTIAQLRDEELDDFRSALAARIGTDESTRLHWVRRAARRDDGEWLLEIARPKVNRNDLSYAAADGRYDRSPWVYPGGMDTVTDYLPLVDGLVLLQGEENPEDEIARRRQLADNHRRNAMNEEQQRRQASADQLAATKRHAEEKPARWASLTREQRALYVVAATFPRTPARALVQVAKLLSGSGDLTHKVSELFESENYNE